MQLESPDEELFRDVKEKLKHLFASFVSVSMFFIEWSAGVYTLY